MTPLAASLVPDNHAAAVIATGPLLAGALFAATGPAGFAYAQLGLCAAAVLLSTRLPHPTLTPAGEAAGLTSNGGSAPTS